MTIGLATPFTACRVIGTVIPFTDGTAIVAEWTGLLLTDRAAGDMLVAQRMVTCAEVVTVLCAVGLSAECTPLFTRRTIAVATCRTRQRFQRPIVAGWALLEAAQAVGLPVEEFVEARTDCSVAVAAIG